MKWIPLLLLAGCYTMPNVRDVSNIPPSVACKEVVRKTIAADVRCGKIKASDSKVCFRERLSRARCDLVKSVDNIRSLYNECIPWIDGLGGNNCDVKPIAESCIGQFSYKE